MEDPIVGKASVDTAFDATVADKRVSIGASADSLVVMNAAGGSLSLRLPKVNNAKSTQTSDGTVIRAGRDVSTAIQVLPDGAIRALVTMNNEQAPNSYSFGFDLPPGLKLRQGEAGRIDIVTVGGEAVAGSIKAPWAKDARGKALPTYYDLNGSTVTQHVDTTEAQYPIVADPDYVYNCGWTSCNWTFTRYYTANVMYPAITGGGSVASILAGAVLCGKLGGAAGAACALWVVINYMQAYWHVINAKAHNACFVARFQYVGIVSPINAFNTGEVNDSNCIN